LKPETTEAKTKNSSAKASNSQQYSTAIIKGSEVVQTSRAKDEESVSTIMGDDDFISSMTFASGEISCNCDVRHHYFSPPI
jgi:hypothetical protein